MALSALEKIQEIQARADQEIKELRQQAISEVVRKLSDAKSLVKELEAQYTQLTGKNLKGEAVESAPKAARAAKADVSSDQELASLLQSAPNKRLNRKGINDAGFNLKSALVIAKASPKTFGFAQNGPQGEVWLK
jgi:D-mannonate dehydratase